MLPAAGRQARVERRATKKVVVINDRTNSNGGETGNGNGFHFTFSSNPSCFWLLNGDMAGVKTAPSTLFNFYRSSIYSIVDQLLILDFPKVTGNLTGCW